MSDDNSAERVVLITGARGGIGVATARRFAQAGYRLVLTDISSCGDIAASPGIDGAVAFHAPCDLNSPASVEQFVTQVLEHTSVDVLVNNAAVQARINFGDIRVDQFRQYLRVNLEAPFQLCSRFVPPMQDRGWGRVINIVSGSAWSPPNGFLSYVSSKMGLVGLTRSLAVEVGHSGVTVNAVTPALTRHEGNAHTLPEEMWDRISSGQAIKRVGAPEDIVDALLFLASDGAAFMTGQTMSVDGGMVFL